MSKIICEICGTTYADTEKECPVCGFEKPETAEFAPEEPATEAVVSHNTAKGGRFSANNVSRRPEAVSALPKKTAKKSKKKKKADRGLTIAVICLLLAIAATIGFIYFRYFAPASDPVETDPPVQTSGDPQPTDTQAPTQTQDPTQTQGTTVPEDLSCTGLTVYEETVSLNQAGSQWLLNVVPVPANTTDVITYTSANEAVATVSADGKITAVGNGETTITITCGAITAQCKVSCNLAPVETQPQDTKPAETKPAETKPAETQPQEPVDFKLRKSDITFDAKGQSYQLYNGDIDMSKIVWTVGNSKVATVKDGVVKAVGPGITNVYAEYNGVKVSCIIRCDF